MVPRSVQVVDHVENSKQSFSHERLIRYNAAVNFCHSHPSTCIPEDVYPKFVPILGLLHPNFCPERVAIYWGGSGGVGICL